MYNTHTLKPFKKLGHDSQRVKKLASKLHVHSVNFAAKLVHTMVPGWPDVPFPVLLSTLIRSRFQAKPATLLIPIDFPFPFRGGGALRYLVPKWLLFLNYVGSGFHCLRSSFFFFFPSFQKVLLVIANQCHSKVYTYTYTATNKEKKKQKTPLVVMTRPA